MFPNVSSKQSFPELEAAVTAYWKEHQTFRKSVEQRPKENPYRFYDGPPFITGTPHYGSLLSSIVKDIVGRYWTMQGKRVERVWGWDCHGLPIEEKVQKKLGINSNKEIEKVGVKQFIDECYNYTAETSAEWGWYIDRIGRWVDTDKAYRTMDQDYMESVMWVFSELYRKGLVYEGKRVSLYSWKLGTPISNFEVAMDDSYQEVNDPAITVKFRVSEKQASIGWVRDEQGRYLLGWSNKYAGWHFVGGACEAGESPETTLIREMEEEIGVKVSQESLQQVAEESQFDTGVLWKATHFEVQIHADQLRNGEPEKFREWKWFTQAELAGIYQETYELDRRILDMML
jgi:ADP-ribose pyrophosphatase YjhB (NUDIX family)